MTFSTGVKANLTPYICGLLFLLTYESRKTEHLSRLSVDQFMVLSSEEDEDEGARERTLAEAKQPKTRFVNDGEARLTYDYGGESRRGMRRTVFSTPLPL